MAFMLIINQSNTLKININFFFFRNNIYRGFKEFCKPIKYFRLKYIHLMTRYDTELA